MGQYNRGDVILTPIAIDGLEKTRPAVVIGAGGTGEVWCCPVSSRPPTDAPSLPLSLDDFADGGLDLFAESYILTTRVIRVRTGSVLRKKGRLAGGITAFLPPSPPDPRAAKGRETRRHTDRRA